MKNKKVISYTKIKEFLKLNMIMKISSIETMYQQQNSKSNYYNGIINHGLSNEEIRPHWICSQKTKENKNNSKKIDKKI